MRPIFDYSDKPAHFMRSKNLINGLGALIVFTSTDRETSPVFFSCDDVISTGNSVRLRMVT
jgi:hypothetical protein